MLRCPWHGWEFDIKTGQSWCHPESVKARTYKVEVVPGEALAKGPFVAETVQVTVERTTSSSKSDNERGNRTWPTVPCVTKAARCGAN